MVVVLSEVEPSRDLHQGKIGGGSGGEGLGVQGSGDVGGLGVEVPGEGYK